MDYKVRKHLSSIEFFNMISDLNGICVMGRQILLDFSDVKSIDGNVVPNLILMGKWIESRTSVIPVIRMGRDFQAGYLKKYLDGIGFYRFTYGIYLYEDEYDKYGGYIGKDMDKKNGTLFFQYPRLTIKEAKTHGERRSILLRECEYAKKDIFRNVIPFLENYIRKNHTSCIGDTIDRIADIIAQMVSNSIMWGESDVYVTIQANHKRNQILLSASDSGIGMKSGIENRMKENTDRMDGYYYFDKYKCNYSEVEAIIQSIYYRKNSSVYGVYNVLKDILHMKGIMRIHSNTKQLILTENTKAYFLNEKLEDHLTEYNTRNTEMFPGVHYEIYIPMVIKDEGY